MQTRRPLRKTKTFWAAIGTLATAAGAFFSGEIQLGPALTMATNAVIGIFIRQGMLSDD